MAAFRLVRPFQALLRARQTVPVVKSMQKIFVNQSSVNGPQCIYVSSFKRFQSTISTEEGTDATTETEKTKSWFIRWLHGEIPEQKLATEEEINERRTLLEKVQEMYFANPPKAPGVEFYTEAFHLLIKYNDRVGVENLYEVMKEEKIPADDKLIEEIETYIVKAREEAWYN
ncbi:Hypothetical predicted protein [Paramuricea clavata]|nr:Hypothetical predicted protein [Paramuricea clavata]